MEANITFRTSVLVVTPDTVQVYVIEGRRLVIKDIDIPFAIFCAQVLKKFLPMKKLMQAAVVALSSTVRKPGTRPKRYPLEAASGMAGMHSTSAAM